jgi:outer membrane murein-binding lipoprotein Lpp
MKRLVLLSLLLFPIFLFAQYPTFSNKQKLGVQTTGDGLIFRGNTVNNIPTYIPSNVNNAYFHLDTTNNKLYLYNINSWQQVYPAPQFDTTTLNVYLKISDTTAMLLPYFRDSDTTQLNLINRFALKLNISDTSVMLSPYLRKADTISLSNRINLKFNTSDTTILSNRITTNANNIITINTKLNTKLDTIYVKFKNVVTRVLNKDTINIGSSLIDGYAINIIGDSINIDTTILDIRYPDRDSTNELQDITFATTSGVIVIPGGKVMNLDTLYNSVIDSVKNLIQDSIAAFIPVTEGYGINIIGDSINVDTTIIFTQSDTITLSNRIDLKLNKSDTVSLSNRINTKLDTIYVNYQTSIDTIVNKDTINITTLEAGVGINIVNNVISLDTVLLDSVVRVQNVYVKNGTGTVLNKGEAVYVTGADGTNIIVGRASNVAESSSSKTLGLTMTSIGVNGFGYVIKEGLLKGLNTNAATAGDPIWLGVNGGLIFGLANKPFAPNHLVYLGVVTDKNPSVGEVYVTIQNGFEIKELHDVQIIDPVNKASLYYNLSESLWRDTTATLLVSDTASMLNPYLRKLDTLSLSNRINLKFNTVDTAILGYVTTYSNQNNINGNKTFNNVITIDSATVTGKLLVNTNISDAVKINSNTNSTNLELMNSGGSVYIKSSNKNMTLQTDTTALVYLKGDVNKVGILTMNPQQALEVAGTIRVDSLSNNLIPTKLVGGSNSNDLTNVELGTGLSFVNDTLKIADNIINSGDTATLLRKDYLGINSNVLVWTEGNKKLLPYFTQVYRNGQLLKYENQYTITSDSILTLAVGSFRLKDNITIIAIDNIVALAGSGGFISLQGNVSGSGTNTINTTINNGVVTNTMLAGSISNDKLDVISTAGKVNNSATTATSLNTNNAIVSRDASGDFSAGIITASLNGNANTATTLATGRTISITGDLTYTSPTFNGSTNITAAGTLANSGVTANTYNSATITVDSKGRITSATSNTIPTVNDATLTLAVSGNGLTGSQSFTANQSSAATFTVTSNATNVNTPSTIVYRDASGNFSAGSITASNFLGNATSSTNSTNTTNVLNYINSNEIFKFKTTNATNVSGQRIVTTPGTDFSVARIDAAQTFTGTQTFSSTISGNISGNAATVTSITPSNFANQTANTVLAAPNGSAGVPTFRTLVAADIPTLNQNTTGTASNVTGTVAVANGGTALTSIPAKSIIVANTANVYAAISPTAGQSIRINAGNTSWETYTPTTGTVTSVAALTLGTTGTDLSSSVATGTTTPVITLNVPNASASNRGVLTSTDWTTFNNKQNALGFTPYNATNPAGYITSSSLSSYLPLTGGTLSGNLRLASSVGTQLNIDANDNNLESRITFSTIGSARTKIYTTSSVSSMTFESIAQSSAKRGFRFISSTEGTQYLGLVQDPQGNVGIKYDATGNDVHPNTLYVNGTLGVTGEITLTNLGGSGNRMVVTNNSGLLSTQVIPSSVEPNLYTQLNGPTIVFATSMGSQSTYFLHIDNVSTVTVTLPTASLNTNKSITIKNAGSGAVNSNATNVQRLTGTLVNSILLSGGGKFATLVSDGFNWITMAAN